jgi:hypothetical protein
MKRDEPARHGPRPEHAAKHAERSMGGRTLSDAQPSKKPSGPVTYKIQKGADVWPTKR